MLLTTASSSWTRAPSAPSLIEINSERVQYWLGVGAQPTEQVAVLLKITGDWQKYKGLPGTEGTLRVAEPKADKKALFEVAAKAAMSEPKAGATTPRKSKAEPKVEKTDKVEKVEKVEKADKADKAESKVEKAEKVEKVEKADKAESKVEKAEKVEKVEKADKAEPKVEKAEKVEKADKAEPKVEKVESPVVDAPVVEVAEASDAAKAEA
jgi:small subunit ribosomal protein S16